jgi:hypothetical protein
MNAIDQDEKDQLNNGLTQLFNIGKSKMSNSKDTSITKARSIRATVKTSQFSFVDSLMDIINREFFLKN